MTEKKEKVLMAMSGGVDSSLSAFLLKEKGYDVVGITFVFCDGKEGEAADAKVAADKAGIEHFIYDRRDFFKDVVVSDFLNKYKQGLTPNPCVLCNEHMKFYLLNEYAKEINADYIATGHYAQITRKDGFAYITKGFDVKKDQSYFLYAVPQEILNKVIFPLGSFTKEEVKTLAAEKGLKRAVQKKESQEVCFISDDNYHRFLTDHMGSPDPGDIVNPEGKVLGKHKGIWFYTIGQRKGMGIAAEAPLYVKSIDAESNTIVADFKEGLYFTSLKATDLKWVKVPDEDFEAQVKIRYLHKETKGYVSLDSDSTVCVSFDSPQWGVTPGQAVVFYQDNKVVGGGTIARSE